MRLSGVPEVYVPRYPDHLIGSQRVKAGDLIFINQEGYYITDEIGPLPALQGRTTSTVAVESHTIHQQMVILYIPIEYTAHPEMSAGIITGEITDDSEDEGAGDEGDDGKLY